MSVSHKQIFYCFTGYDTLLKRKFKHNNNTLYGAKRYRNELLLDKRYTKISDIFEDKLDI